MTKKQRIAELERKVSSLEAKIDLLLMMQRKEPAPVSPPSVIPQRWDYPPNTIPWYPVTTCDTTQ